MNIKTKYLLTLCGILSASTTFAQGGSGFGPGNGGDPNELAGFIGKNGVYLESWYAVKQDLIQGLEKDQHLSLNLFSADQTLFKTASLEALKTVKVEWTTQSIAVDGTSRPCQNFKDSSGIKRIRCNQTDYATAMKNYDSETQYKMIAHEYFSVAGFEPNSYGVSDYPISNQISVQLKEVVVKKWAVKEVSTSNDVADISEILMYQSGLLDETDNNERQNAIITSVAKDPHSTPERRVYQVSYVLDGGCSHNYALFSVTSKSTEEMERLKKEFGELSRGQRIHMQIVDSPNPYFKSLVIKLETRSTCI